MKKIDWNWSVISKLLITLLSIGVIVFLLWKFPIFTEVLGVVIISFIISYSIRPFHKFFMERGINRKLSAIIVILSIILFIAIIFSVLIPWIYSESANFSEVIEEMKIYYERITEDIKYITDSPFIKEVMYNSYEKFKVTLMVVVTNLLSKILSIAENMLLLFIIPTLVYFFLSDGESISKGIMKYIPFNNKYAIRRALNHMDKVMERYIITQFELCGIIGILTFIALKISGIKYALILSLVNAVFNIIPYFGPIIGAIPIVLIALLTSTKKAIIVILYGYNCIIIL